MFRRKFLLSALAAVGAAIAFAALSQDSSLAAKPGGGDNTAGGTVYFRTGWLHQMNSDGSGKVNLLINDGEPSRLLHAGYRWFLIPEPVAGDFYPDGGQRYEIFAYRDDGAAFQLTDDPDLEPAARGFGFLTLRWQSGDEAISWIAQRWDSLTGQVVEAGVYEAALVYDEFGDLAGIVPESVALLLPEADIGTHDWSPDGTRIVYDRLSTGELWIADLLTGEAHLLYGGPASFAVWSPDDSRIAFHEAKFLGDILTIKPDGTSLTRILRSHGGKATSVNLPRWSPTGSHLVYELTDRVAGFLPLIYVYRARADGSGKTNLTPELDYSIPVGWR